MVITIKNVKTLDGKITDLTIPSKKEQLIEAKGKFLFLPGIIDPHICFGDPGQEHWASSIESAIRGGITTAIDIPSAENCCHTLEDLEQKRAKVDQQLSHLQIPLHYLLYSSGDLEHVDNLGLIKKFVTGLIIQAKKLDDSWSRVFQMAAWKDIPILIDHHENAEFQVTEREAFLEKTIYFAEKYNARVCVLNMATKAEFEIIRKAKKRSLLVYAETTAQLLAENNLWEALATDIDLIGSGFNPYRKTEKKVHFKGENFSLANPIFLLPLLLTASLEGKISIEKIVNLTRFNARDIFELQEAFDAVLVNLDEEQLVGNRKLKGWPAYIISQGEIFKSKDEG